MKEWFLIAYMIAGGVLMGMVDRQSMKVCGEHIPFTDLTTGIIAWPGVLTAAFITTTNGQVCSVSTDDKKLPDDTAAQEGK